MLECRIRSSISPFEALYSHLREAKGPGDVVSVDQLVSSVPGFIAQERTNVRYKLTKRRFKAATVFVDHFSRLSYVHIHTSTGGDEAVQAKEAFEAFAAQRGVYVTNILDVVQDVLILSKLVHEFFRPGEGRSDSVQVESEHVWIDRGDLEFFEDTIPDSKYLDWKLLSLGQEGPEKRTAAKRVMDRQTIFVLHVAVESGTEKYLRMN